MPDSNGRHDNHDHLDTWLHDRIEPLSPPPGTFQAIQRRARRRKFRRLAVSAGAAAAVIAAAVTVPQVVKMPVEPARQVAGAEPTTATVTTTGGGPGVAEAPTATLVPLPTGNPVPPDFQPTSVTAVSARTMFVIGQAGTPGQCATQYCTSVARTQDDGGTWEGLPAPLTGAPEGSTGVGQIRFLEGINGWAFGPELWATHDGGEKWTRIGTHGRRVIDVETVGNRAFAIEADCTGTGADYAASCTSFTLYETPATTDDWTPVGKTTTNLNKQGPGEDTGGSAALVLTGTTGYLLAPDGALYAGSVTTTGAWQRAGRIPCAVGLAAQDGTPTGAVLGALTPRSLILSCQTKAIYQSADGGASWQQTATVPETASVIAATATAIAASPTESVILATTQGIQVLPAGSTAWQSATLTGKAPRNGFSFVGMTTPTTGIALPADAATGAVWFTTDGGLTWTPSPVQGPDQ
jgi:photosystem II stability/assembly factor-like uncharacterized protein